MKKSETFATRPGPTNRQPSPATGRSPDLDERLTSNADARPWPSPAPDLVGGGGGAAGGVAGGDGGRVGGGEGDEKVTDHGEVGREFEGEKLALVEEPVGDAEGGGGAGGERDGELKVVGGGREAV
ncbi:hypothetical protein ACJRO7_011287 [Eucalyptus globulus]|uniref:Uncharacterized protein n=1 Tax=Eucalyptus globulus TaxID=34317 RepID=A0ABD3LJA2_EUCGL